MTQFQVISTIHYPTSRKIVESLVGSRKTLSGARKLAQTEAAREPLNNPASFRIEQIEV